MPTLYRVTRTAVAEQLQMGQVWEQEGSAPLAEGYRHIVPVRIGASTYLLALPQRGGAAEAFTVQGSAPFLAPTPSTLEPGGPWDSVEPLCIGGDTYLLAYAAAAGQMAFIPIDEQLRSYAPYQFSRLREPGITKGFDVVQPVVVNGSVNVLCYGSSTGEVNIYSLNATARPAAGSPPGTPALLAAAAWVHQWARHWTRFAFFELGGEAFFLKTNTGKLNVNIDHILDDPSQGTVEVGTYLELDNALELDIVRPFYMAGGDPYFLAYMNSGSTTLYRFHSDCRGWTEQASLQAVAGATTIVPLLAGGETYLLFY